MNKRQIISLATIVVVFAGILYGAQNCGPGFNTQQFAKDANNPSTAAPEADDGWVQIERLARPAVNEGLVISNDKLNAFNSIPPTLDLATSNPAVLAVLQEASGALDLVDSLDGRNDFGDGFDSQVVAGFLPDVMRVDTSKSIPPGTAAYNGDFVVREGTNAAILTGGRKLEDDVMDITLSYLVAGDPTGGAIKDFVTYEGVNGNTAQGHKKLNGQNAYNGPATFPFLALPN